VGHLRWPRRGRDRWEKEGRRERIACVLEQTYLPAGTSAGGIEEGCQGFNKESCTVRSTFHLYSLRMMKSRAWYRFKASFATFSELTNDERTRTFLTLEVGAGHNELRALSDALTPTLRLFRQKEFYADPRFHASIAWALLDARTVDSSSSGSPELMSVFHVTQKAQGSSTSTGESSYGTHIPPLDGNSLTDMSASPHNSSTTNTQNEFQTIPHFPPTLISALIAKHATQLTRASVGVFDVGEVRVKIGKWVGGWVLQG